MQPVGGIAGYPPSPFLVNLIELNNTITSADGLTPLNVVSNAVNDLQQMVNFSQKRIYTNIISKYDTTPIQVTDDINLSNANLYQNGSLFTGSGSGASGTGGISYFSSGTNSIFVNSTITSNTAAIGFQIGGRTVFSFDGAGRALYFDPSGTGNRFWISSATLVADRLQVGGPGLNAASGKFLMSQDTNGTSTWSYVSSLVAGTSQLTLSSGSALFQTNGTTAGAIDARQNWYLGNSALTGNGDLLTSNNFTVVGGGLRVKEGGAFLGNFLTVIDSLGTIGFSTATGSLSSFVVGDQIQNGTASVRTLASPSEVRFTTNAAECARFTPNGFLGLGTVDPLSILDVNGTPLFRGSPQISTSVASEGLYLKALNSNGESAWSEVDMLRDGKGQIWRVSTATSSIQGIVEGSEVVRISTQGTYFGIGRAYGSYNLTVNGPVLATAFTSLSPLRFIIGQSGTEVGRFTDSGNFGIGTASPSYKLQVVGDQSNSGSFYAGSGFYGNGTNITDILTTSVGTGSNRVDVFEAQTRADIQTTQLGISSLSTIYTSTINAILATGALSNLSTISSLIGPGISVQISSFSSLIGIQITANQLGLSSLSTTSYQTASSLSYSNASTLDQVVFSTLRGSLAIGLGPYARPFSSITFQVQGKSILSPKLWISSSSSTGGSAGIGIGYKSNQDLSGAIDASGLLYSRGLRGLQAPFGMGVGSSTTTVLNPVGYTPGIGWKFQIQGDVDISGFLYRNGSLYNINGIPDFYWAKNGSNLYYADGNVGIGTPYPSYPLDVAGRIRCWGVDVIQGPGPYISTSQGPYISPWLYQASNIYYNLGGIGVGTGISSVGAGFTADISGNMKVRGDITASNYLTFSDKRFKANLEFLTVDRLSKMQSSVRGYSYTWKETETKDIGFLAQDVAPVFEEALGGDIEKGLQVSYPKFVPVLWELVRELGGRLSRLEEKFEKLESSLQSGKV